MRCAGTTKSMTLLGLMALAACVAGAVLLAARTVTAEDDVRPATVAGTFYPGSAGGLRKAVAGFLREAKPSVPADLAGKTPAALVVPHAGYVYSGRTAGVAYRLLEGKERPSRVVLIGPAHGARLNGVCSVADFSHYSTPLGKIPVDTDACERLAESEVFRRMRGPHVKEHCLEVQLPFLQVLWPTPPEIVPILVGRLSPAEQKSAAAGISRILDRNSLVIVSTDFTHYGRRFDYTPFADTKGRELAAKIKELDMEGVKHVEALAPSGFRRYLGEKTPTICGRLAVSTMLELFSPVGFGRAVFLEWTNSGDITGDYSDCVSYVAVAVYARAAAPQQIDRERQQSASILGGHAGGPGAPTLTDDEKRVLLALAREAVERAAAGKRMKHVRLKKVPEALRANLAAFVTLRKNGQLRGCTGRVRPNEALSRCVVRMATSAALKDRRFVPVREDELDDITIEISVLGPLEEVDGPEDVRVGRDGLLVGNRHREGVLLPQVATEFGWTPEEFLQNTSVKAGYMPEAWKQDRVQVHRFRALVFGEQDLPED
ncbi:MAG: AmmeMemoRadiSam system protein B [Planctomycetota bacterium]